jgi:hypothetical protein
MTRRYRPLRALLIDPADKQVRELSLLADANGEALQAMYWALGCDTIDIMAVSPSHMLVLDDEGLFKLSEGEPADIVELRTGERFAGKVLVLGTNDEGETVSATVPTDVVASLVGFSRRVYHGVESYDDVIDHPLLGPNTPVFGSRAVFGPVLQ